MSAVMCPHCGSTATLPLPGLGDRISAVFGAAFARRGSDLSFGNDDLARKFNAGEIGAYCRSCRKRFTHTTRPAATQTPASKPRSAVERLKELEQLRAEGLINDDEYKTKRSQILGDV